MAGRTSSATRAGSLKPGYPATPEGQATVLRAVMDIVSAVPNGRGLDIFYRDATWTRVPGNGWENQAFFDFDDEPLPALNDFRP